MTPLHTTFFFMKQKTAYEVFTCLEFRRVLFRSFLTPETHAFIYDIWVVPEHRGKGVGKALVEWAGEWARKRGHRKIKLEVAETNARARHVYESLGFRAERRYMGRILD